MTSENVSAPSSSWSAPSSKGQTLTVDRAQKIIKAFTDDPSWLADPRTTHAANAVFSSAAKVVGMNMQLERLNNSGEAAKTAQGLIRNNIKWAGEVIAAKPDAALPDGTPVSALFTAGDNGKMQIENPTLTPFIAALHGKYVVSKTKGVANSIETAATLERQHLDAAAQFQSYGNTEAAAREHDLALQQRNYRTKLISGVGATTDQKAAASAASDAKKHESTIQSQEAEIQSLTAKHDEALALLLLPENTNSTALKNRVLTSQTDLAGANAKLAVLRNRGKQNATMGAKRMADEASTPTTNAPAASAPAQINSQAEYDAFPGGAYIDSTGKQAYKKPKSK